MDQSLLSEGGEQCSQGDIPPTRPHDNKNKNPREHLQDKHKYLNLSDRRVVRSLSN